MAAYEAKAARAGVLAFKPHSVFLREHGLGRWSHQRHALTTAPLKGFEVVMPKAEVAAPVVQQDYTQELIEVVELLSKQPAYKRTFDEVVDYCAAVVKPLPAEDQERVLTQLVGMIDSSNIIATVEQAEEARRAEAAAAFKASFQEVSWANMLEAEEARIQALKSPEELAAERRIAAAKAAAEEIAKAEAEAARKRQFIASNKNNSLRLGNLPYGIKESVLRENFEEFGHIISIRIPLDKEGWTRGFAFLEYADPASAAKAFLYYQEIELEIEDLTTRVEFTASELKKGGPRGGPRRH